MRNKGAIWTLAISLIVVCLFQLSFTWKTSQIKKQASIYADGDVVKEDYFLDSVGSEIVYNAIFRKYTFRECQQRELNFGLDLRGGMNIILEISTVDILKSLAANPGDPKFIEAIKLAKEMQSSSPEGFITLFGKAFKEVDPNAQLASLFMTPEFGDRIQYGTSDDDVIHIIKEEAQGAIDNAFNIIRTRIDQFGVAQPNIQKLESGDRILVDLPGVKNKDRVRKLLQGTAHLEFWEAYDNRTGVVQNGLMKANEAIYEYLESQKALKEADAEQEVSANEAAADVDTSENSLIAEVAAENEDSENLALQLEETESEDSVSADAQMEKYPLFQVLYPNISRETGQGYAGGVIGRAHYRDTATVNRYMAIAKKHNAFPRDMKFLWDALTIRDENHKPTDFVELYAIKTHGRAKAPLEGDVVTGARQDFDNATGTAYVSMTMNAEGTKKWARLTGDNVDSMVCVVMDNRVYSGAMVQTKITGGSTQITGSFTINEAQDLANLLKSGKLPAPAKIIQETIVGPSLGEESVENGLNSFAIAFIVILAYMLFYYSKNAGLVANIALLTNMFLIVGVLASLGAALTLPGIAGIVLTIGMSVDANVLIYERIREEMAAGKGLKMAITDGYKNAYSAIVDANLTTLITGIILYVLGTGPIKGFATTLVIGILTSLFTAIFVTRLIIEMYLTRNRNFLFDTRLTRGAFKNINWDFIGNRKIAYVISGLIVLAGIVSLVVRGLDPSVDFTGGRNYIVKFHQDVDNNEIAKVLGDAFGDAPQVIKFGEDDQVRITTEYMINEEGPEVEDQIQTVMYNALSSYLGSEVTKDEFENDYIQSSQKVGATIADDIKRKAVRSIIFALIFMFLYIIVRFRNWQFGLGAVAALMHDALIVLGLYSILYGIMPFSLEIDQSFIAAILTVVGYSINDTVVIFDRIREYIREFPKRPRTEILNLALNSTISRTFSTSMSTFVVLITIFILGGEVIRGFIFALMIGVVVGTYSSLYIATPLVYDTISKDETKRVLKGKKHQ